MKKKILMILGSIIFIVLLAIVGTSAFFSWRNNEELNKDIVFNTPENFSKYINYDSGTSSFIGDFQPTSRYCDGASTTISYSKTSELANEKLYATIYLDVNSIDENVRNSENVYWALSKENTGYEDDGLCSYFNYNSPIVLNYGNFKDVDNGDSIILLKNQEVTLTEQTYTIWLWIDDFGDDVSNLSGATIDVDVWTEINGDNISVPSVPKFDNTDPYINDNARLIPVVISDDGTVRISQTTTSPLWYDYDNQKWANAVLISNESTYLYYETVGGGTDYHWIPGMVIDPSDIIAYYVWIPRYKYKLWDNDYNDPQTINIVFESEDDEYTNGTRVGQYRTHPAFWWDYNNNGKLEYDSYVEDAFGYISFNNEMLSGIWVGKFETSPDSSSTCYKKQTRATCDVDSFSPYILPNVKSWRYQSLVNMFNVSKEFVNDFDAFDETYVADSNKLSSYYDSHLMKNSEWGAVAYLAHSVYGINDEIRINNYSNSGTLTGCGADSNTSAVSNTCAIPYGSGVSEYPQSTTGNISGIFDMAGGAWEYVMANYDGIIGASGFSSLPQRKYYDLYSADLFPSNATNNQLFRLCPVEVCGGHSLLETAGWYDDFSRMINATYPWMRRGGGYSDAGLGGIFQSSQGGDKAYSSISWHSVIIYDGVV